MFFQFNEYELKQMLDSLSNDSYNRNTPIFIENRDTVSVHVVQANNRLYWMKIWLREKNLPEVYISILEKFYNGVRAVLPEAENSNNSYFSLNKVYLQEFVSAMSAVKMDVSDKKNAFLLDFFLSDTCHRRSFDWNDYREHHSQDLIELLQYNAIEFFRENEKNLKSNYLRDKDSANCQLLKIWSSYFLKDNKNVPVQELTKFIFSNFLHSASKINGLKTVSTFLFDYVKKHGANQSDYAYVAKVCEDEIIKNEKLKALDNLENLKKKHKVVIKTSTQEDIDDYLELIQAKTYKQEYSWNKVALNKLFKLSESKMTELEESLSRSFVSGVQNLLAEKAANYTNLLVNYVGSKQSGSWSVLLTYSAFGDELKEEVKFFDNLFYRFLKRVFHTNYENVMEWDYKIVNEVYAEWEAEVLKEKLDLNMSVKASEDVELTAEVYKL